MSMQDLRGFVALLEESGQLARIPVEVDAHLEIAAITERVCKGAGGGPALFFEKVRGHRFPVLTNLFGSLQRIAWALWTADLERLAARLQRQLAAARGEGGEERLRALVAAPEWLPRLVAQAPCQEMVHRSGAALGMLPALHAWPEEGGAQLGRPLVFSRRPGAGRADCELLPLQILDGRNGVFRWDLHSATARNLAAWRARGKPMPVAVVLGGIPPCLMPPQLPARRGSTPSVSPVFCASGRWRSFPASAATWRSRPPPNSSSRVSWTRRRPAAPVPSPETTATTAPPRPRPCSASPPSAGAGSPSSLRRWSAARPWRRPT